MYINLLVYINISQQVYSCQFMYSVQATTLLAAHSFILHVFYHTSICIVVHPFNHTHTRVIVIFLISRAPWYRGPGGNAPGHEAGIHQQDPLLLPPQQVCLVSVHACECVCHCTSTRLVHDELPVEVNMVR